MKIFPVFFFGGGGVLEFFQVKEEEKREREDMSNLSVSNLTVFSCGNRTEFDNSGRLASLFDCIYFLFLLC